MIYENDIKELLHNLWFNIVALNNEKSEIDKEIIRKNINFSFQCLDNKKVPFNIQNSIGTIYSVEHSIVSFKKL